MPGSSPRTYAVLESPRQTVELYSMVTPPIMKRLGAQKLHLLVEDGERLLYASDREGLAPLRDVAFERPELLDGSDVAIPVVGLATAYLLIFSNAGRVFADTMTTAARAALKEEGIEHEANTVTKKLPPELAAATASADALSRESITPLAFVEALKRRGL